MERIVTLTLGDWSGDGHSMTKVFIVKLSGDDVSDEAIRRNRTAAETAVGFLLESLCEEYEDNTLYYNQLEKLLAFGVIDPVSCVSTALYSKVINVDPDEFEELSGVGGVDQLDALAVAMGFAGYGDPSFAWEPVILDNILGGYGNTALGSSFGYGLFYS